MYTPYYVHRDGSILVSWDGGGLELFVVSYTPEPKDREADIDIISSDNDHFSKHLTTGEFVDIGGKVKVKVNSKHTRQICSSCIGLVFKTPPQYSIRRIKPNS